MNDVATHPAPGNDALRVACLCAGWCRTCDGYRLTFEQVVGDLRERGVVGLWVDVEDDAEMLGAIDIENFPTLLIARGRDEVLFFGPITPQPGTLARLINAALDGQLSANAACADQAVRSLAACLQGAAR
jgi:hypothetical protein